MTFSVKALFTLLLLLAISTLANGKETICYRLIESSDPAVKIGSIQFISFIGDQCYESDINGISVKNGIMRKNEYQSNRNNTVYNGACFCGSEAKFGISADKSSLMVTSKNGKKFLFKRTAPPRGIDTCSLIREQSERINEAAECNSHLYNNSINSNEGNHSQSDNCASNKTPNSNNQIQSKRKCAFCNGKGSITKNDNAPANFGIDKPRKQCPTCGEWYNPNVFVHYHQNCSHCGGTGYAR